MQTKRNFIQLIVLVLFVILLSFSCSRNSGSGNRAGEETEKKIPYSEFAAQDSVILSSYAVLDNDKGIYQIPINRAMEVVALEAEH